MWQNAGRQVGHLPSFSNTLVPFERCAPSLFRNYSSSFRTLFRNYSSSFRTVRFLFFTYSGPLSGLLRVSQSLLSFSSGLLIVSQDSLVQFEYFSHFSPCRAICSLILKNSNPFRAVCSLFPQALQPFSGGLLTVFETLQSLSSGLLPVSQIR